MSIYSHTSLSQCECTKYYSPESFLSIVLLNDNNINIIDEAGSYSTEDLIYIYTIFEGNYYITDNILTLVRKNKKYSFHIINNGILQALDSVEGHIKNGAKFYCISFKGKDNWLRFNVEGESMGWKNKKMDGTWIFRDHKIDIYHFKYDEGEITKKIYIPKSHESQVLRINNDSLRKRQYEEMMKFK